MDRLKPQDVFPEASMDGFTAFRKMSARSGLRAKNVSALCTPS
jgi:hypothetical protein